MAATVNVDVGDRFHVMEVVEAKGGKNGDRLISRFLPGFGYTATERGLEAIRKAAAEGKVRKGDPAGAEARVRMKARSAKGKVTLGKKGGAK